MCNCFFSPPTTFFPHSSSFSFAFTLPIHPNLQLGKANRNLPKSSSSKDYDFLDKEEAAISASTIEKSEEDEDDRGVGFLEFDNQMGREAEEIMKRGVDSKLELEKGIVRRKKQMMKRSNLIAKKVISIHSALSLGFVSQLWVDINSWIVFLVEVRPNLLSGEVEKFLLEDVKQVGDVVLVEDESVIENEFKLVGLQTLVCSITSCWFPMGITDTQSVLHAPGQLTDCVYEVELSFPLNSFSSAKVGYNVVTPRQRNIGKVRGYTFNINSGAVESLELDCLGISIIPSTLVSTYCLFVEDVVGVLSDTIVVHEAAASRLQRLTKGFWDAQNMAYSADEMEDYSGLRNTRAKPEYSRSRKKSSAKKLRKKMKEFADDWDLPMDFF